jgi:hypothetical protein
MPETMTRDRIARTGVGTNIAPGARNGRASPPRPAVTGPFARVDHVGEESCVDADSWPAGWRVP